MYPALENKFSMNGTSLKSTRSKISFFISTIFIGLISPTQGKKSKIIEPNTETMVNFFKLENDLILFI